MSELLRSLVPLECDLGLKADWRVIAGDSSFFKITKQMHNALQGSAVSPAIPPKRRPKKITLLRSLIHP